MQAYSFEAFDGREVVARERQRLEGPDRAREMAMRIALDFVSDANAFAQGDGTVTVKVQTDDRVLLTVRLVFQTEMAEASEG